MGVPKGTGISERNTRCEPTCVPLLDESRTAMPAGCTVMVTCRREISGEASTTVQVSSRPMVISPPVGTM
jgi:hypothetical protein